MGNQFIQTAIAHGQFGWKIIKDIVTYPVKMTGRFVRDQVLLFFTAIAHLCTISVQMCGNCVGLLFYFIQYICALRPVQIFFQCVAAPFRFLGRMLHGPIMWFRYQLLWGTPRSGKSVGWWKFVGLAIAKLYGQTAKEEKE